MIRCLGVEQRQMLVDRGVAFAVRSCAAEYLLPARLDDEIAVRTRIDAVAGASLKLTQRVLRLDADRAQTELVEMKVRLVCLDKSHRPARMPAEVRSAMAALTAT